MATRPPPDGKYPIKDGEWVGSVAMHYGFADWEKDVWKHPQNSKLKDLRQDPHVLAEGDELFIPPWEEKNEDCPTEKKHRFQLKVPSEVVRIRLLDDEGKPLKNEEYVLELEYSPGGGTFKQENTKTDGGGLLTEPIPSTTTIGRLRFPRLKQE